MDDGSPASTVERTFWTVWNYISGAVSRFFRPEPTNVVINDPNSLQESAVDSKPAKSGHTEGDTSAGKVDEEQHLASGSVSSLSRSVVAWELCTTDIDLGPDKESVQYKTQLSTGSESKEPEEDEGMREEQFGQTRSDEAETLITEFTKENEQEENGVQNTQGQDETQENDVYEEDVNSTSLSLTGDVVSEYVEESGNKAGAEEETERVMTPDDHQKMDETMTKEEEGDEDEDKQCLEEEDIEVKLCRIKDLGLEEEGNMCREETRVQRVEVDTAVMLEEVENSDGSDVLLLASENENKSEGAKKAENQPSVCEELSADHRDFMGEPILTSLHVELQMACDKSAIVSEDELIVVAQEHAMAHRGESEKVEDAKKKEDESTVREQGAVFQEESANEAANKQIIYEVLEQEDNIKSVKEDSQEKQISTGHVTCSEEVVQNAPTQLHTTESADGDQEDVAKDTEEQTKTETDDVETESHGEVIDVKSGMTTTDISVDERFFDKDQIEEERLSSEEGNKESYMEVACTTTSVTVKPEGDTRQEISGEFKNISLEMCEGQLAVSQELNYPTCEETQEGVPEYNNESGPDENTTQRFLEVGDWKEIPATQLPEEVESKEPECLQNSGWSTDYLLVREYMGEEQDRAGDIKNSFDLVVEEHTEIVQLTEAGLPQETEKTLVEPVIQESGLLFGEEEENILVASMKTGIEYSEKDFELDVGLTDDTDKTTKELQDGTDELLVEFEIDEGSCDSKEADTAGDETTGDVAAEEVVTVETLKFLEAEVQNEREMGFFQESVDAINSDQNIYRTTSLQEDFTESGFLEQLVESEPKLLEDSTVEMQDAGIDLQEEEAAEDEVQNKNEMEISNLHVAGMAVEVTTERSEKENTLTVESLETLNQLSGEEALELSSEETETDDKSITAESKPEDLIVISAEEMEKHVTESEQSRTEASCAEETVNSISERQDVIDEEILDLWIQTLSEDTDDVKQQERSEPGLQMDTEREPTRNKEQGGVSSVQTEKDEEQLVESNSGESELVSDTEMSSSTAESGFLDQSVGEWGTQNSETQLLKATSSGSVQGSRFNDMLANMSESADIPELSAQLPESNSESQDILMEETTETRQSYLKEEESVTETEFHPDSGVTSSETRHLDEESDQSQEKTDEETGSQTEIDVDDLTMKTDWKEPEEADIKSITEMSTLFKVEETKVGDEPLETTMSDSPDEIKHTEASLMEGIVSTESHSEENICAESEETLLNLPSLDQPQPIWSENTVDSISGLNRVDMAEQLMTESEDQMEVDTFVLDCTAQRSRIAVKNPRVRPPKDPRSLLHMPSLEPTPSSHVPVKVPAGMPLGGLGIGIKLPGLGAGFPVLKKTQRVVRDENSQTALPQEPETKPMETSDTPKQDEAPRKPKWMPPGHSGFGNPLMSELKSKLKKTTKE